MKRLALAVAVASALFAAGLGHAAPARAENVPGTAGASDAMLAVAADGSPRVAFAAADGSLVLGTRSADGTWTEQTIAGLPGSRVLVVGLEVAPTGATVLLAEDPAAHWLALAEQQGSVWRVRTVATAPAATAIDPS